MGQVVPCLKPDETPIHCAIYVCVFILFYLFNVLVRKVFVCDCMGPEDHGTPCLPQLELVIVQRCHRQK